MACVANQNFIQQPLLKLIQHYIQVELKLIHYLVGGIIGCALLIEMLWINTRITTMYTNIRIDVIVNLLGLSGITLAVQ